MSRTSPLCSWCGVKIPEGLRFSRAEIKKIENEEAAIRKKPDAKEEEIEKKKRKKATNEGVIDADTLFFPDSATAFLGAPRCLCGVKDSNRATGG